MGQVWIEADRPSAGAAALPHHLSKVHPYTVNSPPVCLCGVHTRLPPRRIGLYNSPLWVEALDAMVACALRPWAGPAETSSRGGGGAADGRGGDVCGAAWAKQPTGSIVVWADDPLLPMLAARRCSVLPQGPDIVHVMQCEVEQHGPLVTATLVTNGLSAARVTTLGVVEFATSSGGDGAEGPTPPVAVLLDWYTQATVNDWPGVRMGSSRGLP